MGRAEPAMSPFAGNTLPPGAVLALSRWLCEKPSIRRYARNAGESLELLKRTREFVYAVDVDNGSGCR